jgi:hypothetical protein
MKKIIFSVFSLLLFQSIAPSALAYPDLNQPAGTSGLPIKVYRDHDVTSLYWYIPVSVEPWTRNNLYRSALYKDDRGLSFVFRGQPSVDMETLTSVAKGLGIPLANLTPIAYEESKDLVCQNIYAGDPNVTWLFPKSIGNYLEVVPVSLRVKGADLATEVNYLITHGGLACTVTVTFKAYSMAYKAHLIADLNEVYHRFEAALHGEYFIFEVDVHTLIQSMIHDGTIKLTLDEDPGIPQTTLDQKMNAAFEDVEKRIVAKLFEPSLKIPDGPMAGRGKPFSLRVDYRSSTENSHYELDLESTKIQIKQSQIGLRIANQ